MVRLWWLRLRLSTLADAKRSMVPVILMTLGQGMPPGSFSDSGLNTLAAHDLAPANYPAPAPHLAVNVWQSAYQQGVASFYLSHS